MKTAWIKLVEAAVFAVAVAVFGSWSVRCIQCIVAEMPSPAAEWSDYFSTLQRGAALDAELEELHRRVAAKARITRDVLAGRMTLYEAADAFAQHSHPIALPMLRTTYPDANDEWLHARNVLACVDQVLAHCGDEGKRMDRDRLRQRLRMELDEIRGTCAPCDWSTGRASCAVDKDSD